MARDPLRDLPAHVRGKVAGILLAYSAAMTRAQEDLIAERYTECAAHLEDAADRLMEAVKILRGG